MTITVQGFEVSLADFVRETTQTTGTGSYSLDGEEANFFSFVARVGSGGRCVYVCRLGAEEERGIGTITTGAPATISRDLILGSTNGGNAVSWGAGVKAIYIDAVSAVFEAMDSRIDTLDATALTLDSRLDALETLTGPITKDGSNQYTIDPGADDRSVVNLRNNADQVALVLRIDASGNGKVEVRDASGAALGALVGSGGGRLYLEGNESTGKEVHALASGLRSPIATTSGTSHSFSSIRADARRVSLSLENLGFAASDNVLVQIGPSAGVETSGYDSVGHAAGTGVGGISSTAGFVLRTQGRTISGDVELRLVDAANQTWMAKHVGRQHGGDFTIWGWGQVSLSGALSVLTIKGDAGATFDSGQAGLLEE